MTLRIDDGVAPNSPVPRKARMHQHSGPSKRHLRRKLAALLRKQQAKTQAKPTNT